MSDRFTISSSDVHDDFGKALLGVTAAAQALDVKIDCRLKSFWLVYLSPKDRKAFLEIANEEAKNA